MGWIETMNPVYFMASTPHDFVYDPASGPSEDANGNPNAKAMIEKVLMPLCVEYNLPIALKLGAHRDAFGDLSCCGGGDGVLIADTEPLRLICTANPNVKFLATFLSRVNQHTVCILAQKLRNLHIYGCEFHVFLSFFLSCPRSKLTPSLCCPFLLSHKAGGTATTRPLSTK